MIVVTGIASSKIAKKDPVLDMQTMLTTITFLFSSIHDILFLAKHVPYVIVLGRFIGISIWASKLIFIVE